jgi:hypothetical protein
VLPRPSDRCRASSSGDVRVAEEEPNEALAGETMQNIANTKLKPVDARTKTFRERVVGELERYAIITVYLWLLFALARSS